MSFVDFFWERVGGGEEGCHVAVPFLFCFFLSAFREMWQGKDNNTTLLSRPPLSGRFTTVHASTTTETRGGKVCGEGFTPPPQFDFLRQSSRVVDLHLGYALLLPAGWTGGQDASWWLLLAPVFMLLRWIGHAVPFLTPVRRVLTVVGGLLSLAALLLSASGTLTQALSSLRGGGAVAYALAPVAFIFTYFGYLAPASLLPGAVARAWRGEGFNKPRKKPRKSWIAARLALAGGKDGGGVLRAGQRDADGGAAEAAAEVEKEKKTKRMWMAIGTAAMAISMATGSDVPIFLCFFAQLFKADPSKLMQVMIDKETRRVQGRAGLADRAGASSQKKVV